MSVKRKVKILTKLLENLTGRKVLYEDDIFQPRKIEQREEERRLKFERYLAFFTDSERSIVEKFGRIAEVNELENVDGDINTFTVAENLSVLKSKLSSEGWQLILKYVSQATTKKYPGIRVLERMTKTNELISKTDLLYYGKELLQLANTGDLTVKKSGNIIRFSFRKEKSLSESEENIFQPRRIEGRIEQARIALEKITKNVELIFSKEDFVPVWDFINSKTDYHLGAGIVDQEKFKDLVILKKSLSKEGWKIIVQFIKGMAGINRIWIITKLAKLFSGRNTKTVFSSELRSYSNSSLLNLIKTGDLKATKVGKGIVITPGEKKRVNESEENIFQPRKVTPEERSSHLKILNVKKRPTKISSRYNRPVDGVIYFFKKGETAIENVMGGRYQNPDKLFKTKLGEVLEKAGLSESFKPENFGWSQKAGCSCGCSPGFKCKIKGFPWNIYVDYTIE